MANKLRSVNIKSGGVSHSVCFPSHADLIEGLENFVNGKVVRSSPDLVLSTNSLNIALTSPGESIIISRTGNGAITASSNNTGIATVSVSGTIVTVSPVAAGEATITIRVAGTSTYNEAVEYIPVKIARAANSIALSESSISLTSSELTKSVSITTGGGGKISAATSDSSIATATVSGNTLTVTGTGYGTATITVSVAATTEYTAASITLTVTSEVYSSVLEHNSWTIIAEAIGKGLAATLWNAGDTKSIMLSGTVGTLSINGTYKAIILGIDHNATREGSKKVHFQIGRNSENKDIAFCDSGYNDAYSDTNRFIHNTTNSNSVGWAYSNIRTTILPAFKGVMEAAVKNSLVSVTKWTATTGNSNDAGVMSSSNDELFLLSEYEVMGARTYGNTNESTYCKQYDYYVNGNPKVRYRHDSTSTAVHWWGRSPSYSNSTGFGNIGTNGAANNFNANCSSGIAPGFVIG